MPQQRRELPAGDSQSQLSDPQFYEGLGGHVAFNGNGSPYIRYPDADEFVLINPDIVAAHDAVSAAQPYIDAQPYAYPPPVAYHQPVAYQPPRVVAQPAPAPVRTIRLPRPAATAAPASRVRPRQAQQSKARPAAQYDENQKSSFRDAVGNLRQATHGEPLRYKLARIALLSGIFFIGTDVAFDVMHGNASTQYFNLTNPTHFLERPIGDMHPAIEVSTKMYHVGKFVWEHKPG